MLKLYTRADLEALHTGSIQESLTLEYKSSGAVEKTEAKKMEIAKDVSALAFHSSCLQAPRREHRACADLRASHCRRATRLARPF
jgi:hypothetical protein